MKAKQKPTQERVGKASVCVVCGKPATRKVDGEASCEEHAGLVYEDQLADYTQDHLVRDEWLEKKS